MTFIRQTAAISVRHLKTLLRQPAFIFITLTQPVIWLLLFGALFRRVVDIPGFGSHNYIAFLTPAVVIMTALFSAGWVGMTFIEDMESGVMDRFLTAPVRRGAIMAASLAAQALATAPRREPKRSPQKRLRARKGMRARAHLADAPLPNGTL